MVLRPGMQVELLRGRAPQTSPVPLPGPVRLPGPVQLPGPGATTPPPTTTTTRIIGSSPARTSTPRGQVTPLSSPAAKRLDVRPTPTRMRQGASAAANTRPGT